MRELRRCEAANTSREAEKNHEKALGPGYISRHFISIYLRAKRGIRFLDACCDDIEIDWMLR